MKKLFFVGFLVLVVGMGVGLGNAIRAVAYIVFFQEPIPCKVYLDKKNYFDQKLVEKGRPFLSGSFFQAKVQILGTPIGPVGGYKVDVKVVDVLEGQSPASELTVHYLGSPGHVALPKDHKEGNFYYIMGGVRESGEVDLFSAESDFDGKTILGYDKPHWAIGWFYQLLSECESV
ncbi:MAG: hypothetical protein AB7T38_09605 [Nitrospirales bacterium]